MDIPRLGADVPDNHDGSGILRLRCCNALRANLYVPNARKKVRLKGQYTKRRTEAPQFSFSYSFLLFIKTTAARVDSGLVQVLIQPM